MGFIGSLFNPSNGSGFQAQGNAGETPVTMATTQDQANQLYGQVQTGLGQQSDFLGALAAQGGIGNQSAVFGQQQALAQQLQQQAMGQGPNPVQAQLAQNTSANTANQAALMAGQRGVSQNAGLMARQAAMQGGANQQNMVGQAATLGAQQQLGAQQALMGQQANMAGLAGQQVNQQAQATTGYSQAAQNAQQNVLGGIASQNNANVSLQGSKNTSNASVAGATVGAQAGILGGAMGGVGAAMGLAHGGMVPSAGPPVQHLAGGGPVSFAGQFLNGYNNQSGGSNEAPIQSFQVNQAPNSSYSQMPQQMQSFGEGAGSFLKDLSAASSVGFSSGGGVPGQAAVKGDSYSNDTVPAMLSPGEVVIPRHIMQGKNPADNAKKFVAAIMAKQGMK